MSASSDHHSAPDTFIPQLIEFYRQGRFLFDRLIQFHDFAQINEAAHGPSGLGSYHGVYSFLAFSHERSVYGQAAENPMEAFARPPYAGKLEVLTGMIS